MTEVVSCSMPAVDLPAPDYRFFFFWPMKKRFSVISMAHVPTGCVPVCVRRNARCDDPLLHVPWRNAGI